MRARKTLEEETAARDAYIANDVKAGVKGAVASTTAKANNEAEMAVRDAQRALMVRSTELGGRVFKKSLELARAKKDFARRDSELSSGADTLKEISENVATALTESDDMSA